MKKIIAVLCLGLFVLPVLAATQQQERTKACNAAATKKGLKGDKRQAYVKSCVSAKVKKKSEPIAASKKKDTRPATTAARTPGTPATTATGQQSAASPATAAAPPAATPNSVAEKKRLKCDEIARQSNVSPARNKEFMDKCMAG